MREPWEHEWKDYYALLGLDPSAEAEVVAGAYRALARKYHPDKSPDPRGRRMKLLNEAYEVLSDPERRSWYDREYRQREGQEATDAEGEEAQAEQAAREEAERQRAAEERRRAEEAEREAEAQRRAEEEARRAEEEERRRQEQARRTEEEAKRREEERRAEAGRRAKAKSVRPPGGQPPDPPGVPPAKVIPDAGAAIVLVYVMAILLAAAAAVLISQRGCAANSTLSNRPPPASSASPERRAEPVVEGTEAASVPTAPEQRVQPPSAKEDATNVAIQPKPRVEPPVGKQEAGGEVRPALVGDAGMRFRVYTGWPFDTAEAKWRQAQTARALDVKVEEDVDLLGGVKLTLVLIPAGEFMMGSPQGEANRRNDEDLHRVTIARPFWIGKYSVTQEQWEAVMGQNPSQFKGSRNPVECVSWDDIQEFLQRFNARAGRGGFTLPTEAQWEYACRAGGGGTFCFGNEDEQVGEYAWFEQNSQQTTHAVGQKRANGWGLHDMHGNVWERCSSPHVGKYDGNEQKGAEAGGSRRVLRGGSWVGGPWNCRSAYRAGAGPEARYPYIGFRVVRSATASE